MCSFTTGGRQSHYRHSSLEVALKGQRSCEGLSSSPALPRRFPCKGANPKRSGDGCRSPVAEGSARRGVLDEQTAAFNQVPMSYL